MPPYPIVLLMAAMLPEVSPTLSGKQCEADTYDRRPDTVRDDMFSPAMTLGRAMSLIMASRMGHRIEPSRSCV